MGLDQVLGEEALPLAGRDVYLAAPRRPALGALHALAARDTAVDDVRVDYLGS